MTVSSTTTKNSYAGDGSNAVFAYTFKVFDEDDLTVILRTDATGTETVQTITTNYTVSGVGDAGGGNVTFVTAPASGVTVVIRRSAAITQTTDYTPNDPFPAEEHENALDKLTFIAQQQQEELNRAIKLSRTNTMTSTEFTVGSTARANKILGFDGTGELSVTQELGVFRGDWTADTAFAVRDLIKDTTNDNIYICQTAHTSSGSLPISTNTDASAWELIVDAATATTSATAAAASAAAAATSETNAAASATNAASSATNAALSEAGVAADAAAAAASATAASASETAAAASETAAAASETAAAASETAAASSASSASTSASTATTKAAEAATSATNAATSAASASSSATAAATSAANAATSETNAGTSATNAATSATNAASSATAAAASQSAAAASAASAASAYDSFDDRYLGVKASDPTVDNDGDPLSSGLLYFSSSENIMKVYDGASWIAATSAGNVSLLTYQYTATASQTTFSGADDNAATLSYTVNNILVTLNGSLLYNGTDYTATNGTSVVLASGAASGDVLQVTAFKSFTTADMVPASTGGTFSGAVTVAGAFTSIGIDDNAASTTMTLDGSGNVGIGTSSVDNKLHLENAGTLYLQIENTSTANKFYVGNSGGSAILESTGAYSMNFKTNSTEAARIDSSQNLLVGTTSDFAVDSTTATGVKIKNNGMGAFYRDGGTPLYVNRGEDGTLVDFRKDGTTVGSISTEGSRLAIGTGDVGLKFDSGLNQLIPFDISSNAVNDDVITLGRSTSRFKNLYLSGGVYLGGTGSANYLDDYEEGTWTPTGDTNAGTASTFGTVIGSYVKIGNLVTVSGTVRDVDTTGTTSTSQFRIAGLPFAPTSVDWTGTASTNNVSFQGSRTSITCQVNYLSDVMSFVVSGSGTGRTNVDHGDITSGTSDFFFSVQYQTF